MHRILQRLPVMMALSASAVVAGALDAPAQSETPLPTCPAADEQVFTYPPAYLRQGAALAFSFERGDATVDGVTVRYPTGTGVRDEMYAFPDGTSELRVIRPAPNGRRLVELHFSWDQNLGESDACHGTDSYRAIPIVPARARIGRPSAARLSGRYRAIFRGADPGQSRWTLRPTCDVFGCATRLRSSGGLRGTLRPDGARRYRFESRNRVGTCRLGFSDGTSRSYAVYGYNEMTLHVIRRRVRDRIALRLEGRRIYSEAAPADDLDLCDTPSNRGVDRVRLRRAGP